MPDWHALDTPAKLNVALVVGPRRSDGMHEVATVMERLSLSDTVAVRRAQETRVTGFADDTLVAAALSALARRAGGAAHFEARIEKRIPVAAGLGGGSSDAAAALRLANGLLDVPLPEESLARLAASLGADVPFFLREGPQLATDDGTTLTPLALPRDYVVVLVLPDGVKKRSTGDVYAAFDARGGAAGFESRRVALVDALEGVRTAADLAALPRNDLESSPIAGELRRSGAFRADVTGAGPVVYGLFGDRAEADRGAAVLAGRGATWIATPA
jgi:4-diphosphocytidyl-2-C-methyl-D-erythritol kinase